MTRGCSVVVKWCVSVNAAVRTALALLDTAEDDDADNWGERGMAGLDVERVQSIPKT